MKVSNILHSSINSCLSVYLTVGAPGSGKSTVSKKFAEDNALVRLCPDEFRAIFGFGEGDQSVSWRAFSETKAKMRSALLHGTSVIIDATNMYRKSRKDFLDIAKAYNAKTIAMVFEHSREVLIERIKQRVSAGGLDVPGEIVDNMLSRYQRPDCSEFDEVILIEK
jgi:predicted kinase